MKSRLYLYRDWDGAGDLFLADFYRFDFLRSFLQHLFAFFHHGVLPLGNEGVGGLVGCRLGLVLCFHSWVQTWISRRLPSHFQSHFHTWVIQAVKCRAHVFMFNSAKGAMAFLRYAAFSFRVWILLYRGAEAWTAQELDGVVCYFQWELRLVLSFIVYSIAYSSVFCLTVDNMI